MSAAARPALVLAAVAALAAPAVAQDRGDQTAAERRAERLEDFALSMSVRLALAADARTRPLDLDVTARGGVVQVAGAVPERDRAALAAVVLDVPGVYAVRRLDRPPSGDRPAPPARSGGAGRVGGVAEPPSVAPTFHAVERGDTLFELARRYGTTVDALVRLNGLGSTGIVAGRRLRVR